MPLFPLRRLLGAVLALACACANAQRDPGTTAGGQTPQIAKDSAAGNVVTKVYDGLVAYVRIETRERGAPLNQHPVAIEPATLRALLMRVQLPQKDNDPVFNAADLDEIVAPLAKALAQVLPEQDVSFAVSGRHRGFGLIIPREVTTARVFFAEGRMNLIFGLVREDWESRYRATAYLIPFEPGKRAAPVDRSVRVAASGGAVAKRADWLVLDPLAPPPVEAPADAATPKPAVVIPATGAAPAAPAATVPAPAPQAAPVPQAAPAPQAAGGAPPADSDALYRQTAERLKALKKLRDDGVITEEEYQQKRREILKGL
jgi:hypothetical protein